MDIEKTRLIPIERWNEFHDWPPIGGLRHLRFYSEPRITAKGKKIPGNGFATAFKMVGKRLLIDETEFFRCVENANNSKTKLAKSA